jgi:serine/threonine-protein kinase RsbW
VSDGDSLSGARGHLGSSNAEEPALKDNFEAEISKVGEIAGVMAFIESLAKRHSLPDPLASRLQLACDELITNAITYGYPDGRLPRIHISISHKGDRIETKMVDDGIAFNPLAQPNPDLTSPLETRETGGLGVYFIRTIMNDLDYHRRDGHNHLKMVLQIPVDPAKEGKNSWPIPS